MTTEIETVTVDFEEMKAKVAHYYRLKETKRVVVMREGKMVSVLGPWRAGKIFESQLRSLDAIHVITALENPPIDSFVSHDRRQLDAARQAGLPIASPGMKR